MNIRVWKVYSVLMMCWLLISDCQLSRGKKKVGGDECMVGGVLSSSGRVRQVYGGGNTSALINFIANVIWFGWPTGDMVWFCESFFSLPFS